MINSGIYSITHQASGKLYVGSAINIRQRFWQHQSKLRRGIHDNIKLQHAWNKYGEEAFEFSVIEYVEDRIFLMAREQCWINRLNAASDEGFNILPMASSRLGYRHSRESRIKMSLSQKGRKHSPETKEKMSTTMRGRKRQPFSEVWREKLSMAGKGRYVSDETRLKMALSRIGYVHSPATLVKLTMINRSDEKRQKLSLALKGRRCSNETREKISVANRGRRHGPPSIETRAKISQALRGRKCHKGTEPAGRAPVGQSFEK